MRSFDAVCHLVEAGLGVTILPRAAVEPVVKTMGLALRPLAEDWARRRLLIATRTGLQDDAVRELADFLAQPSPNAKAPRRKRQ